MDVAGIRRRVVHIKGLGEENFLLRRGEESNPYLLIYHPGQKRYPKTAGAKRCPKNAPQRTEFPPVLRGYSQVDTLAGFAVHIRPLWP